MSSNNNNDNDDGNRASAMIKKEKTGRKALITGAAVICEMLTGGLFLENVKMEKQRTSQPYKHIAMRTLKQGLPGFWAGFWPWGFTLGMTKGMVLGGSRAFFLNQFLDHGMTKHNADLVSGFFAGACQGIVMGPVLLGRTRVNQYMAERIATQGGGNVSRGLFGEFGISMNILNVAIREEGIKTIFIGMPTMVLKRSLDWGSRFLFMRYLREWYQNNKSDPSTEMNDFEKIACTFLGSSSSVLVLQPLDRMMPIIQASRAGNESVMSVMKQRIASEGFFSTMQRGIFIRWLHIGWHTTFAIFFSQKIYDAMDKRF